jgi:hypothetical protein
LGLLVIPPIAFTALFTEKPLLEWYSLVGISLLLLLLTAFIVLKNLRLVGLLFGKYQITIIGESLSVKPYHQVFKEPWSIQKSEIEIIEYIQRKNKLVLNQEYYKYEISCMQKEAEKVLQFLKAKGFVDENAEMVVYRRHELPRR